jgi:methyl-accepting chemotaxis protein
MFKNIKLWIKLSIGFGTTILVVSVITAFSFLQFRQVDRLSEDVTKLNYFQNIINQKVVDHLNWVHNVKNLFLDERITELSVETDDTKCGLGKWLASEDARYLSQRFEELKILLEQIIKPHHRLHAAAIKIKESYRQDNTHKSAVKILNDEAIPAAKETIIVLEQIRDFMREKVDLAGNEINTRIEQTIFWTALIFVFGILFAIAAAVFISLNIIRSFKQVIAFAAQLKAGDLSAKLTEGKDEAGQMAGALNAVVTSLNEKADAATRISQGDLSISISMASEKDHLSKALEGMVGNLNFMLADFMTAVDQVDMGARQVSSSSQSLSQCATEQAASLEEITSSMTEIGSQTRSTAENTAQANKLAADALLATTEGVDQMTRMVAAMADIKTSSLEISKIIKTIDAISFQTNLLALNAAVEAARAGKHGKGFAVVAQEVRTLATRSAKAAQETADLIKGSGQKVEDGNILAEKTSQVLIQIKDQVTKVSELVAEIAAAGNEQAQGISQINQGLNQIDSVTQQNSANAEETSSASDELASQANKARQLIGQFKLRNQNQRNISSSMALTKITG